jgi:hypothetical protein
MRQPYLPTRQQQSICLKLQPRFRAWIIISETNAAQVAPVMHAGSFASGLSVAFDALS